MLWSLFFLVSQVDPWRLIGIRDNQCFLPVCSYLTWVIKWTIFNTCGCISRRTFFFIRCTPAETPHLDFHSSFWPLSFNDGAFRLLRPRKSSREGFAVKTTVYPYASQRRKMAYRLSALSVNHRHWQEPKQPDLSPSSPRTIFLSLKPLVVWSCCRSWVSNSFSFKGHILPNLISRGPDH